MRVLTTAPAQRYDLIQMPLSRRIACCVALLACGSNRLAASDDEEKMLRIESEPAGAHVVINGRDRGTTPFEMKVGHWAFSTKKPSVFSKHLSEPWILEVS